MMTHLNRAIIKYTESLIKVFFFYSGLQYLFEKFKPIDNAKRPVGFIWLIGLYFAIYAFSAQRYESQLNRVEFKYSNFTTQVASGAVFSNKRLIDLLNERIPVKPHINLPSTVFKSFLNTVYSGYFYQAYTDINNMPFTSAEDFQRQIILQWNKMLLRADFSNSQLENIDFSNSILTESNLSNTKLKNTTFFLANAKGTDFTRAKFEIVDFSGSNLNESIFHFSTFDRVDFSGAKSIKNDYLSFLSNLPEPYKGDDYLFLFKRKFENIFLKLEIPGANLEGTKFNGAQLNGVDFSRSKIIDTDFSYAHLKNVNFSSADIQSSRFAHSRLENVIFTARVSTPGSSLKVDFYGMPTNSQLDHFGISSVFFDRLDANIKSINFFSANIINSWFGPVELNGANFNDSDIKNSFFQDAEIRSAYFWDARISNCNFDKSDLRGTSFYRANLLNNSYINADLRNVNLENVTSIKAEELILAYDLSGIINCPKDVLSRIDELGCSEMLTKEHSEWSKEFSDFRRKLLLGWGFSEYTIDNW